ncbi:hypothetical protein [Sporohalobacter salinus]|uniref:hypothetical protein n=1 Tax=Sporohalobacter salinus TaxID=1494606 RepID=UPI00195F56B4|nr:hypothetical protein [Sporohalobacter salinus]MBM7625087.1 hypothetical protein [Sporohalobacter salinus]
MINSKKIQIALILVVLFLVVGFESNMPMSEKKVREKVLDSLEDEYNEKFRIKSFKYTVANKSYQLEVYPKKDPDIIFDVRILPMTGYQINDDYITEQWFIKTEKYIKKYVNRISRKNVYYAIARPIKTELFMKLRDREKATFKEIMKNYRNKSKLATKIYAFKDITSKNEDEVLKDVYELVKFIREEGFKTGKIEIEFYDEDYFRDKDVEKLYEKFDASFNDRYNNFLNYRIDINEKEFHKVKSIKGVKKNLRVWDLVQKGIPQNPEKPYEEYNNSKEDK